MKSLGANRNRHLSDSCGPAAGPQEPICPLTPDPHTTYLLTPAINHYGTLDQHMHAFPPASPIALQPDCLLPLSAQLTNSSAFPHFQFPAQPQQQGCLIQPGSRPSPLTTSMPMGMGLGLGLAAPPMISSGTATISSAAAAKMNRLPASLLDQLERHLPLQRDGFSTLQFHRRSRGAKQRSESPGRIRNLVHSVQRLFTKAPAGEGSAGKGGPGGGQGADGGRVAWRSKSKDRAKTEGAKRRARPNLSGFWSSDDTLEDEAGSPPTAGQVAVAYRNPLTMMTLGRAVSDSQAAARPNVQGYNTIATHSLRTSQSSGDLKPQAVSAMVGVAAAGMGAGTVPPAGGQQGDGTVVKRGSWSTLTLTQARQVVQKGTATLNRTLLKSKSSHQDLTCNFLQVPLGDMSGTLGKGGGGGPGDIPCRRMRSGSYVKAMAETEDSDESEGPPSPKPSPKTAARRQSYLKATQQSLSEQQPLPPPRNCLPSLRELSTNRSLDNLDCLVGHSDAQRWEPEGRFGQSCSTLGRSSGISQVDQQGFLCSMTCGQVESQAVEALDLPTPSCFRSRSHSYLRAIQAGCSQDDDTASVDSDDPLPPPPAPRHTYGGSRTCKKTPPPVPPRIKPLIALNVQSSTESAQDTYLDNQDKREEANSQSGRSNSSDSVTSSRTGSLAKGAKRPPLLPQAPIPAPREPPLPLPSARVSSPPLPSPAPETPPISITLVTDEPQAAPRRKLSSIGIQVDCVQPVLREEQTPTTRFQSIGVQVEDGRPLSRYSSMASRQETTEVESQDQADGKSAQDGTTGCGTQTPGSPERGQRTPNPLKAAATRSVSGSIPESLDPALDPSSLPPPDPSLQIGGSGSLNGAAEQTRTPAACLRDGHWFLKLLQAETGRMEAWCQQMEQESKEKQLSEEVLGKIRSAVGSAQLLMSQKFQQFRGLCEQNLDTDAQPRPTAQDLAGFWDLLQLSIEDISMKFDELHLLKSNAWNLPEDSSKKEKEDKKQPSVQTPKKVAKAKSPAAKEKSSGEPSAADKQRQEARKRLMAAKRAVSERQNSATESADSIEIYVPEAQTRL